MFILLIRVLPEMSSCKLWSKFVNGDPDNNGVKDTLGFVGSNAPATYMVFTYGVLWIII